MSTLDIVIALLCVALLTPVSEMDYHNLVKILRHYDNHRQSPQDEQEVLTRVGWPHTYHPCDHMENIRFVLVFTREGYPAVATLCQEYYTICKMFVPSEIVVFNDIIEVVKRVIDDMNNLFPDTPSLDCLDLAPNIKRHFIFFFHTL
jgi:hypothetical protein